MQRPGNTGALSSLPGSLDRAFVVIVAQEPRIGKGLGHDDSGRAVPASDIGHAGPALQLGHDAIESWEPGLNQVHQVGGLKKALSSGEQARVMLVPTDAFAGPEGFLDPRFVHDKGLHDLESRRQKRRAALVGEEFRVLVGERKGIRGRSYSRKLPAACAESHSRR